MQYSEFCEEIEECIEKMSRHLDAISEANRKISRIESDHDWDMLNRSS